MAKRKKPVVNIDARVSKSIKREGISKVKGKPSTGYSRKEVKAYIEEWHKGKVKVVTEKQYEKLSDKQRDKVLEYREAERQYKESRTNWFHRYKSIDADWAISKGKRTYIRRDKVTGERKEVTTTRTVRRYRDTKTGRFISYKTVKEQRVKMRKEAAILKISEKKKISKKDARKLYNEFVDKGMERYILKEYAETP